VCTESFLTGLSLSTMQVMYCHWQCIASFPTSCSTFKLFKLFCKVFIKVI
jgi:hypothetical protein